MSTKDKIFRVLQDVELMNEIIDKSCNSQIKMIKEANLLDEYLKIPTVEQVLQTGSGLELDNIAEKYKFKTSRWEEETDSSFRSRLWAEFYNGVWETEE